MCGSIFHTATASFPIGSRRATRGPWSSGGCSATSAGPPFSACPALDHGIDFLAGGYRLRFFDRFDEETRRFEDDLRSGHTLVGPIPWPRISIWQGYRQLPSLSGRDVVLQIIPDDSESAYQMAVISRPTSIA